MIRIECNLYFSFSSEIENNKYGLWSTFIKCVYSIPQEMNDAAREQINSIGTVALNDDGSCSIENCVNEGEDKMCKLSAICEKLHR